MTKGKTKSSTRSPSKAKVDSRRLSEVARHVVAPDDVVSTGWPRVYKRIRSFGDEFDQWQQDVGSLIFGKRVSGEHAATVGGITLSIARQVAKTFMIGRIVFALCTLFPGLTVIWTAHRTRTSDETFRKLSALCQKKQIAKYIDGKPRQANGQQEIRFRNGSRIMFGAREGGFGRGFDEVDVLVFDEAQILTEKALEDMVAATNQSRWEPGALVFFMGTPPRPIDPGEAFTNRRADALEIRGGKEYGPPSVGGDAIYIEASADSDANADDRDQWKKGNPSFPFRTPLRSMLRLRKLLPSVDSWRREGMGIWDEQVTQKSLISVVSWNLLAISPEARPAGKLVCGVKFSVDGSLAALSVGVKPDDAVSPVHVDPIRLASTGEGYQWIVDWIVDRRDQILQIVIDGKGSDALLIRELKDAGLPVAMKAKLPTGRVVRTLNPDEYGAAHETFYQRFLSELITHGGDENLAVQVGGAMKRKIGQKGSWGWAPTSDTGDTTLLDSVTLAFYGASTVTRTGRRGGRIQ